jgi:hypothetical protein
MPHRLDPGAFHDAALANLSALVAGAIRGSACVERELRKRHSKRGKKMERARGSAIVNSLSMYSITENIYCSQLSSVAILLQPEPNCFTSYNTRK